MLDEFGEFPYFWKWKKLHGERFGHRCKITSRGHANIVDVEFEDGFKVTAPRYAVRLINPDRVAI